MTMGTVATDSMAVGPLPRGWTVGNAPGQFQLSGTRLDCILPVAVRVFHPLEPGTQYLLNRFGARDLGPLGRPQVHSLPTELADGVSILAFHEADDGSLTSRIDLVRRAWDRDISVSASGVPVEAVDEVYEAMLELLATVLPAGAES